MIQRFVIDVEEFAHGGRPPRGLNKVTYFDFVFDAGRTGFDSAGDINRPGLDGAYALGDILWVKAAGQHQTGHSRFDRERYLDACRLPCSSVELGIVSVQQ